MLCNPRVRDRRLRVTTQRRLRALPSSPGPDLDLAADALIDLFASTRPPAPSSLELEAARAKRRNQDRLEREQRSRRAMKALRTL